ncbi:MAG TPA: amidohydrolase family protein [Candidatus Brocadiia bacterium]|nr:amidohydrolase family protein [Candidatus Brocadiia bacterium]
MIYDADTWAGQWPFRSLPRTTVAELLSLMDRLGIEKALVANLHGLLYTDVHEANHELHAWTRKHRDRLSPAATINPTYDGWRRDLRQCREEFSATILKMYPDYHGYSLRDHAARELVQAAGELGMIVALTGRVVDPRGRHRLDPGREVDSADAQDLIGRFPDLRFLMLNFSSRVDKDESPRCLYSITRFMGENGLRLGKQIREHGAARFCVGTTMLLRCGTPALLGLEKCGLGRRENDAVSGGNLNKLLAVR